MDRVASHVAAALNAARALAAGPTSSSLPDAERVMDVHLDAADTAASEAGPETDPHAVVMRIAALGARGAAAMAAGDAAAADAATREIFERTLGPSDESNDDTSPGLEFSRTYPLSPEAVNAAVVAASDKPHGAAVAHAIKQCAQWSALNDESDLYVDIVQAVPSTPLRNPPRTPRVRASTYRPPRPRCTRTRPTRTSSWAARSWRCERR